MWLSLLGRWGNLIWKGNSNEEYLLSLRREVQDWSRTLLYRSSLYFHALGFLSLLGSCWRWPRLIAVFSSHLSVARRKKKWKKIIFIQLQILSSFFLQGYILGILWNLIHVFETTALHLGLESELHNILLCWFTVRCFFEYNANSERLMSWG